MYFTLGLYSSEGKVKKTIIEILTAAIKLYEDGHQYVMDALQDYKVIVTLHENTFVVVRPKF